MTSVLILQIIILLATGYCLVQEDKQNKKFIATLIEMNKEFSEECKKLRDSQGENWKNG